MSQRRIFCPTCNSVEVETVKVHDPDTHSLNSDATLKCAACQHVWEGLITSEWTRELFHKGEIRL